MKPVVESEFYDSVFAVVWRLKDKSEIWSDEKHKCFVLIRGVLQKTVSQIFFLTLLHFAFFVLNFCEYEQRFTNDFFLKRHSSTTAFETKQTITKFNETRTFQIDGSTVVDFYFPNSLFYLDIRVKLRNIVSLNLASIQFLMCFEYLSEKIHPWWFWKERSIQSMTSSETSLF